MDKARLLIMTALASAREPVSFTTLQVQLQMTGGNLSTHLRKLENEDMVIVEKSFHNRKPLTTYRCTDHGRELIMAHLRAIERLIRQVAG